MVEVVFCVVLSGQTVEACGTSIQELRRQASLKLSMLKGESMSMEAVP